MKHLATIIALFTSSLCWSQEMDIFQNDSIYSKNKIKVRRMYHMNGTDLQKEIVTYYNSKGQKIKQYWFWNGDSDFHNVESFYYSKMNLLTSIVDSIADFGIQKTSFFYRGKTLLSQVTINQNRDTVYFKSFPDKRTEIQRWYSDGKPYRFDTTIYEKENVKSRYYGIDYSNPQKDYNRWNYKFLNEFDKNGNLTKVWSGAQKPYSSFIQYFYDKRNLLIRKKEMYTINKREVVLTEYSFVYQ